MSSKGPIKGGGNVPTQKSSVQEKTEVVVYKTKIENIIDSSFFKTSISLIPLVSLLVTVLCTNYYYFFDESYFQVYDLISFLFGFSVFSLPAYFFIVYRYGFCVYSKLALWGLSTYVLINLVWFFIDLFFDIKQNIYTNVFESFSITTILLFSIYFLITKEK